MATNQNVSSIEEQVEDWCKNQFHGQKYYTKTEVINSEIDEALSKANKALGNAEGTAIDVKATRSDIQSKQKATQGKRSYKATHTDSK